MLKHLPVGAHLPVGNDVSIEGVVGASAFARATFPRLRAIPLVRQAVKLGADIVKADSADDVSVHPMSWSHGAWKRTLIQ